jgi:hypothetical protein
MISELVEVGNKSASITFISDYCLSTPTKILDDRTFELITPAL